MRIFKHFDTVPEVITLEHYNFYLISNIAYTCGWATHAIWMGIFFCLGQTTMAWYQFVSIGCHVAAIALNRRGLHQPAMIIGTLEVATHQVLAVYIMGWGAGFQYIIIATSIFPFLQHDGSSFIKTFLVLVNTASYVFIEVYLRHTTPVSALSPLAEDIFNYINIVMSFCFMATWGFFITVATKRTEAVLTQRNKELYEAEKAVEHAEIRRQLEVKERDKEIYRLRNEEIHLRNQMIEEEKKKSETLLLNILPEEIAYELLKDGNTKSRRYDLVTIMFTDFVNFTHITEQMKAEDLVKQMDRFFMTFDSITRKHGIEKIKTIGDAYMCAGGLPVANTTNPIDVVNAAIEILNYIAEDKSQKYRIRIGIHTGPVVAGVVGRHKFQYDIWGDAVNIAARMEQSSEPGRINISGETYELVKDQFNCDTAARSAQKIKESWKCIS
ncbi:MAG: hypothetical protein K0Q79_2129 [Flavipsychrobacter sp.]|nr:hypothetical protein [Flavipsychrobacter sp.]